MSGQQGIAHSAGHSHYTAINDVLCSGFIPQQYAVAAVQGGVRTVCNCAGRGLPQPRRQHAAHRGPGDTAAAARLLGFANELVHLMVLPKHRDCSITVFDEPMASGSQRAHQPAMRPCCGCFAGLH